MLRDSGVSHSLTESSFRSIIEQAPVAMALLLGPDFVVSIANQVQLQLWQKSEAEVLGKELFQIFPELNAHDFKHLLSKVYLSGEPYKGEEFPTNFFRNGVLQHAWFDFVYQPYRDEQGVVVGVLVVSNEVTDKIMAKKELRENELFSGYILEGSADCVKILSEDGRIKFMNRNGCALMEIDNLGTLSQSYWWELWPEAKQGFIQECVQKAASGEIVKFQEYCPTVKGNLRWWDIVLTPARNTDGTVTSIIAISHDITSLKDQAGLLQTVIESTSDLVWAKDLEGRITLGNQATFDLFAGGDNSKVLGIDADHLFPTPETAEAIRANDAKVMATGRPLIVEEKVNMGSGEQIFQSVKAPLYNSSHEIIGIVGVSRDITEQKKTEQELRDNEARLKLALEAAFLISFEWDIQHDEVRRFHSTDATLDRNDHIPSGFEDVVSVVLKEDQDLFRKNVFAAIESEDGRYESEFRVGREDGSYAWFYERGKVEKDASGKPLRLVGLSQDITTRKTTEEILKKSESRFRTLTDNLPQMVWVTDSAGKTEYISKRWEEYSGIVDNYEAWAYMVHPDDWEPTHRCWQEHFEKGISFKYEVRLRNKDGEYRWHYSIAEPVKNNQGEILHWVGVLTDIEDQKNIADILRKSEEYFRQLADLIPQIIWTATADGSTDYFNSRWYEFTGSQAGYGDSSWIPVLHPDDVRHCIDTWYHSVKTGDPYQIEYRFKEAATGNYRWFLGKAVPIRNSEGLITRWFGACTDIHDQKMMRVHLEQLVDERTKELRRSNEDLQQFAHVASHDLKEPVRKVIIFGSRLREEFEDQIPERARNYIAKMEKAAHRMYSMIDGVLMYSSINALRHTVEEVDLNVILCDIESDLEVFIIEKKAKIKFSKLPVIPGSPILIHQLFYNIVNNSLKFSKPGVDPCVEIGCFVLSDSEIRELGLESGRPYVKIEIQDNGIGFGEEEAERIFDTFTRLHAKDKFEGTGLGLALCKKIVERHGGRIFATGVEGEGAQFTVILPME